MTKVAVGIDIGGTSTKIGAVDENGRIHFQSKLTTNRYSDFQTFIKVIAKTINRELNEGVQYLELIGVGIGAPHGVRKTGNIEYASNLPWKGILPLRELLEEELDVKVLVTNDANAAAIGEKVFGGAKEMKDFVMITLGTGLGSAIYTNNQLVEGFEGFAGELGHVIYNHNNGRHCRCGRRGCLETYVSATGIKRTVYKLLADHFTNSDLRGLSFNELSTTMITDAAKKGDPIALEAFDYTGRVLGSKLAETVHHTNPEAIFLLGGLSKAGDYIFKPTKEYMEQHLMGVFQNKVQILPSQMLGASAAVLGAAGMLWNSLENQMFSV